MFNYEIPCANDAVDVVYGRVTWANMFNEQSPELMIMWNHDLIITGLVNYSYAVGQLIYLPVWEEGEGGGCACY